MNRVSKIFFWIFTIALGFVNPLISVALVVLYYLPKIISDFFMARFYMRLVEIGSVETMVFFYFLVLKIKYGFYLFLWG